MFLEVRKRKKKERKRRDTDRRKEDRSGPRHVDQWGESIRCSTPNSFLSPWGSNTRFLYESNLQFFFLVNHKGEKNGTADERSDRTSRGRVYRDEHESEGSVTDPRVST